MPRALGPRPSGRRAERSASQRAPSLPREVVGELRRTARAGKAESAISRMERAVELVERGDTRAAVAEAVKAKALAPRSGAVREVLGLALYGQGMFREALTEMRAYRRMTGRADQNHIIADCHRALGHPERAVPLAEEALAAPRVPLAAKAEAVVVAASALADMGRFDQALGLLRRVKTREDVADPEVIRVWYVTADVLERAGRREEAERVFRTIMRHDSAAFDVAERVAQLDR